MPSTLGIVASGRWSPLELLPALWLDAADTSTITESGGSVSQWNDKSGYGRHVSRATSAQQPTTGAATHNGLNVVSFNGSQDLRNAAPNLDSDLTIVSVFKVTTATTFTMPGPMLGAGNIGQPLDYYDFSIQRRTLIDTTIVSVDGSRFRTEHLVFKSWVLTYSKTTSTNPRIVEYINNTETFNVANTTTHNVTSQRLVVGRRADGVTSLNGQIAEVFIFDRILSSGDRSTLQHYLSGKWNL